MKTNDNFYSLDFITTEKECDHTPATDNLSWQRFLAHDQRQQTLVVPTVQGSLLQLKYEAHYFMQVISDLTTSLHHCLTYKHLREMNIDYIIELLTHRAPYESYYCLRLPFA